MVESREAYDEQLDLLMREAIVETDGTLGPGKRDAPAFWRCAREEFLRRVCASADRIALLRALFGDETIGIKVRPWFDRLKRNVPRDDGGGTKMTLPDGHSRVVPPSSPGSEDETATTKVSTDGDKLWSPEPPPKTPPRPHRADPVAIEIKWRVWSGFEFHYRGKSINVADLPVHRVKPLEIEFGKRAVAAVVPFNVLRGTREYIETQAYVHPESLVRDVLPEAQGEGILAEAQQRAAGMLFMLPKGLRVPAVFYDD